jgi:prophage antirepressor-like protein
VPEIKNDTQVLAELCSILGLSLPEVSTEDLNGQPCECVNEAGVYVLMFNSYTGKAKKFRKWVRLRFLPDAHKSGELTDELRREFQMRAAAVLNCNPSMFARKKDYKLTI